MSALVWRWGPYVDMQTVFAGPTFVWREVIRFIGLIGCSLPSTGGHSISACLGSAVTPGKRVSCAGPGGRGDRRLESLSACIGTVRNPEKDCDATMHPTPNRASLGMHDRLIFLSETIGCNRNHGCCRCALHKLTAIHGPILPYR